jgi:hypothetical protein
MVTEDSREWLDDQATTRKVSLAEVVREALDQYREQREAEHEEPIPEGEAPGGG